MTKTFSFESFADLLKSDPSKLIDSAFKKAEKNKKDGEKTGFLSNVRHNTIVANITVKRYIDLIEGKNGPTPRRYIDEIEQTEGIYGKRNSKIRFSVKSMSDLISKAKRVSKSGYTVLDLHERLYKQVNSSKWGDAFNKAYKLHKKGVKSATMVFMKYVFMVYALEYLTLTLREYAKDISIGLFDEVNKAYTSKYRSFVSATAENVVPIVVSCENTSDPKKYVDGVIKIEKKKSSEENYHIDTINPDLDKVSQEDAIGAAVMYGALSIVVAIAVVHGLRYIIYSLSCLTVDISKSLIDQSYTLLVGIEHLETKLSGLKPDSREYKELQTTIEKQKQMTAVLIDVARQLSGDDIESLDDIRSKELQDNDTIEDSESEEDEDNSGNSGSGGLDI